MFKNRGGLLSIIVIILIIAAFLFLRRQGGVSSIFNGRASRAIPLDVWNMVPSGWDVQSEPLLQCDFDGDRLPEWLIFYRYNDTTLPAPLQKAGTAVKFAPFGGVIYDTQADTLQSRPDNPGPYRATNIVPYKLLPDYYNGKGQGYLGETSIRVSYWPPIKQGDCKATEINVYGFSNGEMPTRLSVFRWAGRDDGYQGAHFAGDARVESIATAEGQINAVTTYNRLENHRSVLCDVQGYVRQDLEWPTFTPNAEVETIDFCFGAPNEPVYPEGVVVSVLRAGPPPTTTGLPSYFLGDAVVASELQPLLDPKHALFNIVTLGNPSSVIPDLARGAPCTKAQVDSAANGSPWCDREEALVKTRIMLDGVARDATWTLISVVPITSNANLYWRIKKVELS